MFVVAGSGAVSSSLFGLLFNSSNKSVILEKSGMFIGLISHVKN